MTGQEECVEALLQRGASVSVKDIRGRSPLHLASASGRVGALGALLQATNTSHSHTNLTDSKGYTPLHWACYNGIGTQREMFENHVNLGFFLRHSTVLSSVFTSVFLCFPGYDACVEVLLDQEVFRKITGNSFSPLHCAV